MLIQARVEKLNEDLHQPYQIRYISRSFSVRYFVSLAYRKGLISGVKLSVVVPQAIGISLCNIYVFLSIGTPRTMLFQGGGECHTPVLTPFALKIHDVYIVINRGVELKAKAPPLIWLCYVSVIGIVADGISCYPTPYSFGIM